ncbi:flavodoxin family protein [Desulfatiglans anilini]|uniref:flavodoxin family protein n=1 Tax=Desulfatiglans anilini TaxID=90728 RepID=UPI000415D919|nr:flavodoxin family protein [Desulfatiglans anilini]
MNVLGIYGSPRKGGNTDRLLDSVLEGAQAAGAEVKRIYVRKLKMSGCIECGGCDKTGECVVKDDMQEVYPMLAEASVIFLASPIFFYGITAQAKALVDRSQAMWARRMLLKTREERKRYDGGTGYLVAAGATKGKTLFDGARMEARYFFDALDMHCGEGFFARGLEKRSDLEKHPELLEDAFRFGREAVEAERTGGSPAAAG